MQGLLSENVKIVNVSGYASAATSGVDGSSVDMAQDGGYDGVVFVAQFGTAAANNVIHAECSSDDADADAFADIADSEVAAGASDETQYIDILYPPERYVRPVALRGTSTTLVGMWAILYRARSLPVDNDVAGTIAGVKLTDPIEGTK